MLKVSAFILSLVLLPGCFSPKAFYYQLHFKRLNETLIRLEHTERKPICARQIQTEIAWLYAEHPNDLMRIGNRLADLTEALEYPEKAPAQDVQNESSGLYGVCYRENFFQLQATALEVQKLALAKQAPPVRLNFLDAVNSAEKLKAKLNSLHPGTREFLETRDAYRILLSQNLPKGPIFLPELRKDFSDWDQSVRKSPE